MGVILDSSILIESERGRLDMAAFIAGREDEPFGISVISVSELLHGVHRADSSKRRLKRSAFVEKVIELFPIYSFEIAAARIYAEIWADLLQKGSRIGSHDLMIGATAISLGYSVATLNRRHFERIDGLTVELLGS